MVGSAAAQLATVGERGGLQREDAPATEKRTTAKDRCGKAIGMPSGTQRSEPLWLAAGGMKEDTAEKDTGKPKE